MVQMSGSYTKGKSKGRQWEVYADPAQTSTGYTRKEWDPHDSSNNGGPTEYFSPFNFSAAQADDQVQQQGRAEQAARAAQASARQQDEDNKSSAFWQGVQQANERQYQRGVTEFDQGMGFKNRDLESRTKLGNRELDIRKDIANLDNRTRLQLGLKELELREREGGAQDMRSREKNVMDYLTTIGKLKIPYTELMALQQRAVQGIIPGGAAPAGAAPAAVAAGAGANGGGALTPDQWQALAQGVGRDWEGRQIGQGSPAAA